MKRLSRILLCILVLLGSAISTRAQSSILFGHAGLTDYGYRVIPATDGGFWVGGEGEDSTAQSMQYWVARFSSKGTLLWDSTYGGDATDFLWSIQPSADGGVLLAGYTGIQWSGAETALMLKLDSTGHTVARYNCVDSVRGIHSHFVGERPQGGYMWTGHTVDPSTNYGKIVAGRLNENFEPIWQKRFPMGNFAHAHCGLATSDGGMLIVGHTDSIQPTHDCAIRLDSNGNVLWSGIYMSTLANDDEPYGLCATRSGGFAIFGGSAATNGSSSMWLLVLDATGHTVLDKHYGLGSGWGYSGIQCSDGGFVEIGGIGTAASEIYAVKTDSVGNVEWTKTFAPAANSNGNDVFQHNNQLVMVGEATKSGQSSELWGLFTDMKGVKAAYDASIPPAGVAGSVGSQSELTVNPNPLPSGGLATFTLPSADANSIAIYNAIGQEIYSHHIAGGALVTSWNGTTNDGSQVTEGIYVAVVRTASSAIQTKFVVK